MAIFIWFIRPNATLSHDVMMTIQLSAMSMNDDVKKKSYLDSEQLIQPVSTVIEKETNQKD